MIEWFVNHVTSCENQYWHNLQSVCITMGPYYTIYNIHTFEKLILLV